MQRFLFKQSRIYYTIIFFFMQNGTSILSNWDLVQTYNTAIWTGCCQLNMLLFFFSMLFSLCSPLGAQRENKRRFCSLFLFSLIVLLSTNKQKNQNAFEYNTIFIRAILMRLIYMHFKWFSELKSPREDHFNAIYGFCGLHLFV